MSIRLLTLYLGLFLFFSCNERFENRSDDIKSVSSQNVFGKYDRRERLAGDKKFSKMIGRIKINSWNYCTASLISSDTILTAAHCFFDEDNQILTEELTFTLGLSGDSYVDKSSIMMDTLIMGGTNYKYARENDWAIVRLKKTLGEKYGHFKLRTLDDHDLDSFGVKLAGYIHIEGEKELFVQDDCNILNYYSGNNDLLFEHDCDVGAGDSGAPLFRCSDKTGCEIYGIHVASVTGEYGDRNEPLRLPKYDPRFPNLGVSVKAFQ